jgi:hypothetical protein
MTIRVVKIPDLKPMKAKIAYAAAHAMDELLPDQISTMERRLDANLDVNNARFKEYHPDYAKRKGVDPSNVNMELTGRMRGSMTWATQRSGWKYVGRIFLNSAAQLAKAKGNTERGREWFGFTARQWEVFMERLEARLREAIR